MTKAKLSKLSVCECGFLALKADIPLGTEYEVDLDNKDFFTFTCGGCYKVHKRIECVYTQAKGNSHAGYLPIQIFEIVEEVIMEDKDTYIGRMMKNEHAIALFPDLVLREKIFAELWEHNQKFQNEDAREIAQQRLKYLHEKYGV